MLRVEASELENGQPALKLYAESIESFLPELPAAILGDDFQRDAPYEWLIGYAPVIFEPDLVIAKTVVRPGMSNTPETALLDLTKVDLRTKKQFAKLKDSPGLLERQNDFEDIRLMQKSGFEQIRPTE